MIQILAGNLNFGPGKVFKNLTAGLDLLNVEYVVNPNSLDPTSPCYCLSPHPFLLSHPHLMSIGPNICVLPIDMDVVMEQRYKNFIVPCKWVYDKCARWLPKEKIKIWPVGIDTGQFKPSYEKSNDCLIYVKNRSEHEVEAAKKLVQRSGHSYKVIEYGSYKEAEFIDLVRKSVFCFVVGNTESQGIALQEIMSCNVPLFVWDKTKWDHRGPEFEVDATTVPYWNDKCGAKFSTKSDNPLPELNLHFRIFCQNLSKYQPRQYILENLNLGKQAKEFCDIS